MNHIYNPLRFVRRRTSLSQKDLAARLDVTPQYINDLENGRKAPSFERVPQIFRELRAAGFDLTRDHKLEMISYWFHEAVLLYEDTAQIVGKPPRLMEADEARRLGIDPSTLEP